jgi:SAM-dependent methyltransferase
MNVAHQHLIHERRMAGAYTRLRPIPSEIGAAIAAAAQVHASTRVLELATGTGSLAIALAAFSDDVTAMDASFSFLAAAGQSARRERANVNFVHGSCNELTHLDGVYDVVTLSQALHWLDPYAVCRGLHRVLAPGGFFFLVSGVARVPEGHPPRPWTHFADPPAAIEGTLGVEAAALARLLEVSAPLAQANRILPVCTWRFKQRRAFTLGLSGDDFWSVTCYRKLSSPI